MVDFGLEAVMQSNTIIESTGCLDRVDLWRQRQTQFSHHNKCILSNMFYWLLVLFRYFIVIVNLTPQHAINNEVLFENNDGKIWLFNSKWNNSLNDDVISQKLFNRLSGSMLLLMNAISNDWVFLVGEFIIMKKMYKADAQMWYSKFPGHFD